MILIDEPQPATLEDYTLALDEMVETLRQLPGLLSVYQIGGFGAPGISDIDMVAVFEDGAENLSDPQAGLTGTARYLFCHQLFGTTRTHFAESQLYTSFHNYRLLHGTDLREDAPDIEAETLNAMQRQLAHEYLVRMWINLTVERSYHILKSRSLLLQGNGLTYDLDFLGQKPPALSACIDQIMAWRSCWYDDRPTDKAIKSLHAALYDALQDFLNAHFKTESLYLPARDVPRVGRNILLQQSDRLSARKSLPTVPWMPKRLARKAMAAQSRVMNLHVGLPFKTDDVPDHIQKSFDYTERVWAYNRKHLPSYMPLTSSLVLQP